VQRRCLRLGQDGEGQAHRFAVCQGLRQLGIEKELRCSADDVLDTPLAASGLEINDGQGCVGVDAQVNAADQGWRAGDQVAAEAQAYHY
jgi:hypothetical protein